MDYHLLEQIWNSLEPDRKVWVCKKAFLELENCVDNWKNLAESSRRRLAPIIHEAIIDEEIKYTGAVWNQLPKKIKISICKEAGLGEDVAEENWSGIHKSERPQLLKPLKKYIDKKAEEKKKNNGELL